MLGVWGLNRPELVRYVRVAGSRPVHAGSKPHLFLQALSPAMRTSVPAFMRGARPHALIRGAWSIVLT
jgi:hypothetical protein